MYGEYSNVATGWEKRYRCKTVTHVWGGKKEMRNKLQKNAYYTFYMAAWMFSFWALFSFRVARELKIIDGSFLIWPLWFQTGWKKKTKKEKARGRAASLCDRRPKKKNQRGIVKPTKSFKFDTPLRIRILNLWLFREPKEKSAGLFVFVACPISSPINSSLASFFFPFSPVLLRASLKLPGSNCG